jgi:predicted Zn-dependent peptidase
MKLIFLLAPALALFAAPPPSSSQLAGIRFTDIRLDNGLRVIVAEDHYAPVYSIAVTYNVGSRDERPGRTGFAHLFEHMMFKGSDKVGPGEHFYLVFNNGGNMNGTTNTDRTLYFETLPKNQLDLGLFLEADRMRSLAITKENLDNQRNAVQEERRLGIDNRPYGKKYETISELAYDNPAYKHSVIGSMEDLNAATIEDVRDFFKTYYAPNNAVVAIVGDVNTADVLARVKKYFGDIPRQEPPKPVDLTEKERDAERRTTIEDKLARVPQINIAYRIAPSGHGDYQALSMLSTILAGGESSRLYQKLVKEKEVASSVYGYADGRTGPALYHIVATVRQGKSPGDVESLIDEEIARVIAAPVTEKEMLRARSMARRMAIGARESTLGRAIRLADDAVLHNDPGRINSLLPKQLAITPEQMQQAAKKHLLRNRRVVIHTIPAAPKAD